MLSAYLLAATLICSAGEQTRTRNPREASLAAELRTRGWIAYSALTDKGDWDLFLTRPDGSRGRNLTNTQDYHELGVRFSPDGRRILFRRLAKATKLNHSTFGALGQLMMANADGSGAQAVGADGEFPWASWGPGGAQIACLTKSGIEFRDVATRKLVRKLDRKGIYMQLVWSPDGQWLTGPANSYGENWTVVRLSAGSGEVNAVSKFQNCTADWFPDSKRLIYSSRPANQTDEGGLSKASGQKPDYGWTQLWMASGDGVERRLVYGEDGRHVYGGNISPDGKYVLFTTASRDGGMTDALIHLMRLKDAPVIGGASPSLRRKHPDAKEGPVMRLTAGWEPHWSFASVGGSK